MTHQVVIVGAGPAGLSAAYTLCKAGLSDVVVLERDVTPGGVPRYCGHAGFGIGEFYRPLTGPGFVRALTRRASGVEIRTGTTVLALEPSGTLLVSTSEGIRRIAAQAVLIATGIRETPRSARLVSGTRPWGVTTTGAFQEIVQVTGRAPFRRPVIVGSELVAFSNLLTARHVGVRPVALIEEAEIWEVPPFAARAASLMFRTELLGRTKLLEIVGKDRVEAVILQGPDGRRTLACDGVIFSGRFVPEATLARTAPLQMDRGTNGPCIDSFWRCSDPAYFAAGNVLRSVESAGWAAWEGREVAAAIRRALNNDLPSPEVAIPIRPEGRLRYIYPQRVICDLREDMLTLYGRAAGWADGTLRVNANGVTIATKRLRKRPGARVSIRVPASSLRRCRSLVAVLE
jgi:NADPH-dependent 2,4-dienoyl-CoA reductase/sulfur reductase-like enzyme